MSDQELREFTRVPTAFPTQLSWAGGQGSGTTRDVSINGVFVVCATPPAAATTAVEVALDLGGEIRISGRGTVVRVLAGGCAIRFDELDGVESYEHLRRLVLYNSHSPERVQVEIDSHLGLKRIDPKAPPPA